jgi:hypothetical protein
MTLSTDSVASTRSLAPKSFFFFRFPLASGLDYSVAEKRIGIVKPTARLYQPRNLTQPTPNKHISATPISIAPKLPGSTNPGLTTALTLKNKTTLANIITSPTIFPDRVLGIKHTCNSKEGIA